MKDSSFQAPPLTGTGFAALSVILLIASVLIAIARMDVRIGLIGFIASLVLLVLARILDRLDEIVFYLKQSNKEN